MKSKTLRVLNVINWLAIASALLLIAAGLLSNETGGGTLSAIATITALTAMLWAPVLLLVSTIAFVLEIRILRAENHSYLKILRAPSTYVLAAILYVLSLIFLG